MTPEQWSGIISASVIPVVVISACGLMCLAFYNRLASIVARLRQFQKERIQEEEACARLKLKPHPDKLTLLRHERMLELLETQTKRVTRRARLIRVTLLCLLATIALLVACSFFSGLSTVWPQMIYIAAVLFYVALALLVLGIIPAFIEMTKALEPIQLERQLVSRFARELGQLAQEEPPAP
jgi:hypothetical protein